MPTGHKQNVMSTTGRHDVLLQYRLAIYRFPYAGFLSIIVRM